MAITDWLSGRVFNMVHGNNLVYNTCWEDPRLDRVALRLGPEDVVVVITSAGCNTLDYVLTGPRAVHAVDMNPRQNALLELKVAGIKNLEFEDFFEMFGRGYLPDVRSVYSSKLRGSLSEWAQDYWDRWIKFFGNPRHSFYYRGTSGSFARFIRVYTDRVIKVRPQIDALLNASSFEEQQELYHTQLRDKFWTKLIRFAMNRDTTLSMIGVPKAQRRQVETQYEGGIVQFVQDCVDAVFGELPISDNYFWRVYMTGHYTNSCCPEYLKEDNFQLLKEGLIDRVHIHTDSVQGFLEKHDGEISRFVLLDHMDWLSDRFFPLLESEWQAIVSRAAPGARLIWRSGGLETDFLDNVQVRANGQMCGIQELLSYDKQLASELHVKDRVHTYGSFYIADLSPPSHNSGS
jgi:S-adenosylmethionine-diacylglycerol 3-amino-3-carboxypropyl transferase